MVRHNALWSAPALALLLIVGVTSDAGAAPAAQPVKKTLTKEERTAVRKQEEETTKKSDKNYAKQAKAQAQYYKKLAQELKKSGGTVQPLLDAAAYFDSEAKK